MKNKTTATIILIGTIIAICLIAITVKHFTNTAKYNNGICQKCGGQMTKWDIEFQTIGNTSIPHYIYKCENCGHTVDLQIDLAN